MSIEPSEVISFINDTINNGVPVKDTFTWRSAISNAVITIPSTILGAIIGSKVTLNITEKQERIKIKQDLRMKFYDEYEIKYKEVERKTNYLEQNLESVKLEISALDIDSESLLENIKNIKFTTDISVLLSRSILESSITAENLHREIKMLEKFMQKRKNKTITRYKDNKFGHILQKITTISNQILLLYNTTDSDGLDKYKNRLKNVLLIIYNNEQKSEKIPYLNDVKTSLENIDAKIHDDFVGIYFK